MMLGIVDKKAFTTFFLAQKVSPNYFSQTLSSSNVSEDTNVTLLPKRELFFLNMSTNYNITGVSVAYKKNIVQ